MTFQRCLDAEDGNAGRRHRLIALVLLLAMPPVSAGIFKWIDANGQVHYGERPPPGQETLEVPSAPSLPEADVRDSQDRLNRWLERQERDQQLRREDEEKAQQEASEKARDDAAREAYCLRQRRNLSKLQTARPIYRLDEQGERAYLDDEARARNIEQLSAEIRNNCR